MDISQQIHGNRLVRFLQLIEPSTPRHVLSKIPDEISIFEPLGNSGSKTKQFTFYSCQGGTLFEFLAQSNQARYVEEIKLYKTTIGTPDSLQSLALLTQIKLDIDPAYQGTEIDFTSCLNGFPPSLECFSVTLYLKADMSEHVDINIQSPGFKKSTSINPMKYSEGCALTFKSASQTNLEEYLWHPGGVMRMEKMGVQEGPCLTFTSAAKVAIPSDSGRVIRIETFSSN